MANKTINKMKELYHVPKEEERLTNYRYSDFEIKTRPLRQRKMTIAERINKFMIKPRNQLNTLKNEPNRDEWVPPDPIYTCNTKINVNTR